MNRASRWSLAAMAFALFTTLTSLPAQDVPKRPQLQAGSDTNSAPDYYDYGIANLTTFPQRAADALYWASQIDPTWAQPLYARRIALLLAAPGPFVIGYVEGTRSFTHSKQGLRIDSLELRARMLNPFYMHEFDKDVVMRYLEAEFDFAQGANANVSDRQEFRFYVERYWRTDAPPYLRAILAVNDHRFPEALRWYHDALAASRHFKGLGPEIHMARGQIFYVLGNDDSALVEMQQGLDSLRGRDAKEIVYLYESKGVLEHGIGLIYERMGQPQQARDAYVRALQEDLSYYPAHLRLGLLAFATGDTTTALNELELAAQIKEDEPWVQTTYGAVLAQVGRLDDANQHLRRAVQLAPFYAAPYYALGRVAEMANRTTDAVQNYKDYLARARSGDPRVQEVQGRLTTLQGAPHQ